MKVLFETENSIKFIIHGFRFIKVIAQLPFHYFGKADAISPHTQLCFPPFNTTPQAPDTDNQNKYL